MNDLLTLHKIAMGLFEVGRKSASDLHFSGKLQVDSFGDLVIDVPSAMLRGCFAAIKEPGAELCVSPSWKARFVVINKSDLDKIGGGKAISERGKDFDFNIVGSKSSASSAHGVSKIWYLSIECPDAERIRQSYGLSGKPEHGFQAIFGIRRTKLFADNEKAKEVRIAAPKPGSVSGEWKWIKADLLSGVQLQPHQQRLADEITPDTPAKKLLMWQVGSGKSLGSMAAAEAYGKPYTVIGPASVRSTFKNEQKKFTDMATPSEIMSYQKAIKSDGLPHPESLIVDEAQRATNPGSRQSIAVQQAARKAKQILLLSGTPITNRPGDIAPLVNILTGKSFTPDSFESRYLGQKAEPRSWSEWFAGKDKEYQPVLRNKDELKAMLEGKVDWYAPDKPVVDTQRTDHEVDMSPEQTKLYQAMFGKIPLRLRMGLDNTTNLTPKELTQLRSFLAGPRQVGLSDYPFAKHKDPLQSFNTSSKLQLAHKLLMEKINSDPRTKAIVYSNFPRAGLEPYRAALQQSNIPSILFDGSLSDAQRDDALKSFNAGDSRVAFVGPAGAEGISLRGAQLLQQLDPHWHHARGRQSEARGIRYDSHSHLPEDLRNIQIQRFISRLPPQSRNLLQLARLMPYSEKRNPASDEILNRLSDKKDEPNRLMMELLQEIGTRKQSFYFSKREVIKTANLLTGGTGLSLPAVKIDRPKGFQKVFQTPKGPLTTTYPVDYGYFDGLINPEDNDGADVFMGSGGPNGLHGRFMKGQNLTGKWLPDERKWYANLTPEEHKAVLHFYHQQDPKLLADHVAFKTHQDLLNDLNALRAPATAQTKLAEIYKSAQMVAITVHDSCSECHAQISLRTSNVEGSGDVVCPNCGKKNFVYTNDKHKNELINKAVDVTAKTPSKEQFEAGNYTKGKFGWHGLVISLENPAESTRRGTSRSGKTWEVTMKDHYGYILKHVSEADGDNVDVFVASDPDHFNRRVYVIDQYISGKFDEHKCVLMAKDAKHAKEIYNRNYSTGWDGFGNLSTLTISEFKKWLVNSTGKPLFVAVPKSDISTAEKAVKEAKETVKKVDPTGKNSGDYGEIYLCKRSKEAWVISGDWWSEEVCQHFLKVMRKALPDYDWDCDAETVPSGYDPTNMGDWARIQ